MRKRTTSIYSILFLIACTAATVKPAGEMQVRLQAAVDSIALDRYCNARFGYCIDYPPGIISPEPESANGDGRIFIDKKGEEVLRVWGRLNIDPDGGAFSIAQQYRIDLKRMAGEKGDTISYKKLGKTFFVISGHKKGKIFYQKAIVKDDAFAYAILTYNENDKVFFDKMSDRLFRSFK